LVQDPKNKKSLKRNLKKILRKAKADPNILILAEDEAALISIAATTRMWALKGIQPKVNVNTAKRKRVTLFGAVSLTDDSHFSAIAGRRNTETFSDFLKYIYEENQGKRIIMILDNVRFHHAKVIKEKLLPSMERLEFVFLPVYSPDLNPQEWVWKELRHKVTHNAYYENFYEELKATHDFLKEYVLPTKQLLCRIIF